jgi:hypothetical protein
VPFFGEKRDGDLGFGFDARTAVPAFLANPGVVLVELSVVGIQLMPEEIMPVAYPAVAPEVSLGLFLRRFPDGMAGGRFHVESSPVVIRWLPG